MEKKTESEIERIVKYTSMHRKGVHAFYGFKAKQSYTTAFKCFQKAYELGSEDALVDIGVCYMRGLGVQKDIEKGSKIITECYERKLPHAYQAYGRILELGEGVDRDYEKALECYIKATEYGEARAFSNVGDMYLHGKGCERSVPKAMEAFRKGHRYGDTLSSANLGLIYLYGMFDIEKNYGLAFDYLTRAVSDGNVPSYARLAKCYAEGLGCEKDVMKADELYSKAYREGDYEGLSGMAEIRKRGEIKAFPHRIFRMFKEASEHGIMEAQYNLGMCYLDGFGTKRSVQDAIYALSKATSQYDLRSLKVLNRLQMEEQGPSDDLKAKLIIAARCNDRESMEMLWKMESDEKPPEDLEAWFWKTYGEGFAAMELPIGADKRFKTYSFIDGERFRRNVLGHDAKNGVSIKENDVAYR